MSKYKNLDLVVELVCEMMGIKYHHHDLFDKTPYENETDLLSRRLKKAVCVVYSEPYGPWRLAINYDGTITLPVDLKEEAEDMIAVVMGGKKKGFFA